MSTAALLTAFEPCHRKGFWARDWERITLDGTEMLQQAIRAGVMERERADFGERAGEEVMSLAEERGLETKNHEVYDSVIHHAALADILTTAIRKATESAWQVPEATGSSWASGAFLDPSGTHLRRVVLASSWNDERHYAEIRSWYSLGEIAQYNLPMQQVVLVLGSLRDGRRHSPWSKGLLHPHNHRLRFRKRTNASTEGFKDTWARVWREDHAEIDRTTWLRAMLEDDVLRDVCFNVDIPVPGEIEAQRLRDMAARKVEQLAGLTVLPDPQLSTCDWPNPCVFQRECHAGKEPSEGRFFAIRGNRNQSPI